MTKWRLRAYCSTEDHKHHRHVVIDLGVHELPSDLEPFHIDCEKCNERPKASKKHKYCESCSDRVTDWYASMAVRTYKKREPNYNLSEKQVVLILKAVGDKPDNLYRWGRYLDHWLASGWHIGQAGLGNVLDAYMSGSLDDKLGERTSKKPKFVDARPKEDA